ncbi:MAG: phosphoribosyl-ATP pyrophosphohydrolase [Candidatus Shapirobacteria bacterium]|nr:phosphoribosyl-ATP pyrophosphohydrolase [Candidatus Shapirobacteria bacterium]
MNFKLLTQKLAKGAFDYGKRHNIEFTPEFAAIKLNEEVGEFNQALLIHQRQCRESKYIDSKISRKKLGYELADIIGMAIANAKIHGIDIEKAIDEKWIHREIAKSWEIEVSPKS